MRFTVKSPESHFARSHVARNLSHVTRNFSYVAPRNKLALCFRQHHEDSMSVVRSFQQRETLFVFNNKMKRCSFDCTRAVYSQVARESSRPKSCRPKPESCCPIFSLWMHLRSLESTQKARVALGCASSYSYVFFVLSKHPACIHNSIYAR
ncbi:hypothetical protein pdam_00007305 [Pocillopora damicornis]|uniref:Uncharacterized protein n=1 Tax=Pocillopora damicornis TaxID=46731 RepID=A0A3M6V1H9_POCDA|nr:hypothetical protein pdam_00007305 [Pocillopora damicornis]